MQRFCFALGAAPHSQLVACSVSASAPTSEAEAAPLRLALARAALAGPPGDPFLRPQLLLIRRALGPGVAAA